MTEESHLDRGKQSLSDHIATRTREARVAYGSQIDYAVMQALLKDSRFVRYPVQLKFNAEPLQPGEFAYMQPVGDHPQEGFVLFIHPFFQDREDVLPMLMAYHLVCVNYGEIATHEEAELFGAGLLGMDVKEYYQKICELADSIPLE